MFPTVDGPYNPSAVLGRKSGREIGFRFDSAYDAYRTIKLAVARTCSRKMETNTGAMD